MGVEFIQTYQGIFVAMTGKKPANGDVINVLDEHTRLTSAISSDSFNPKLTQLSSKL